jgi:hypothetical protein
MSFSIVKLFPRRFCKKMKMIDVIYFFFSQTHRHKNTHNEVVHQPSMVQKLFFHMHTFAFKKDRHSARPVK